MDPFHLGDPYINWNEENAAQELSCNETEENVMSEVQNNLENIQAQLKGQVITLLVSRHDFSIEDAEEAVSDAYDKEPTFWGENAEATALANYLASEDDSE